MNTSQVIEVGRTEYENDPELLGLVLRPYRSHCQYLESATVVQQGEPRDGGLLSARCSFAIPESCYIDDTGHFNAVEFNICYNQMLYYIVAKAVQDKLVAPLADWTMDDYWSRQLADFLITNFRSVFKRSMRGARFRGEIDIEDIAEWEGNDLRPPLLILRTSCRYWDESGGQSFGEVTVAITNPPAASNSGRSDGP